MRIKALDSIRGTLLLQMTLDHFGKPISHYLYQCFGFFSAAEGFFFLSGFVGALAAFSKSAKDPKQTWMRSRAFKIWKYHSITLAAVAIAACTILTPIREYFSNFPEHPVLVSLWSIPMVNTPDYLDVLPLYVVFLLIGSALFPQMIRGNILAIWCASVALWIAGQYGLRDTLNSLLPRWINHGFFDPLCWQFLYVTGAAIAACWKRSQVFTPTFFKKFDRLIPLLFIILVFLFLWRHEYIPLQQPSKFWISKAAIGPLRFVNFMVFVSLVSWIVRRFPSALDFKVTNVIGRHSLDVFTAHIVLVYIWLATPGSIRYHEPWNIAAPIAACLLLWLLAKIREPRQK